MALSSMLLLMLLFYRRLQIALINIAFVTLIFGAKNENDYNCILVRSMLPTHCNQIPFCCAAFSIHTYCIGLMDNGDWGWKIKQMKYKGSNFSFVFSDRLPIDITKYIHTRECSHTYIHISLHFG